MKNLTSLNNIRLIKWILLTISASSFLLQVLSFPSYLNISTSLIILTSSCISFFYIFNYNTLIIYPISCLMILGYTLYYFFLPPIATFLESKPVINNLLLPSTTLFHSNIGLLTLIITHAIYRKLYIFTILKSFIRTLYQKLHVFTTLQFSNIVVISFITILSQLISIVFKNSKDGNLLLKFLDGLNYFVFLPYILIAPSLVRVANKKGLFLFYFSIIILIIGAIVNGRSFVFIGYANLSILYFFLSVYGIFKLKVTRRNILKIISIITFLLIIIEPATKLAISMALARSIRDEATPIELLSETFNRYKSIDNVSDVIQTFEDLHLEEDTWDEHYVNNPFFGRLCNLKYTDNIFVISQSLTSEDKESTKKQEIDKTISILPQPIISLLNIPVNKEEATSGSMGDYLFFLTGGINEVEGSRTGSLIGTLFIIFDWIYPFMLGFLTLGVYIIGDSYIIFEKGKKVPIFSPIAFLSFYPFLFFFTSSALGMESISGLLSFILRGSIQTPIIYIILLGSSNLILKVLNIR